MSSTLKLFKENDAKKALIASGEMKETMQGVEYLKIN